MLKLQALVTGLEILLSFIVVFSVLWSLSRRLKRWQGGRDDNSTDN